MKERKETISLTVANILSFVLLILFGVVYLSIYLLIWDTEQLDMMVLPENNPEEALKEMSVYCFAFCLALFGGIVVHELIHGITWAIFANKGFKSISFGVMWKALAPYCHCDEPLLVRHYAIGAAMPLIVLGFIPAIISFCTGSLTVLFFAVIFSSAAIGDIMVLWKIRKEPNCNMVLDHPTEAGYLVYEEE